MACVPLHPVSHQSLLLPYWPRGHFLDGAGLACASGPCPTLSLLPETCSLTLPALRRWLSPLLRLLLTPRPHPRGPSLSGSCLVTDVYNHTFTCELASCPRPPEVGVVAVPGAVQGVVQGPAAPAPPESPLEMRPLLPACSGSRAPGGLNMSPETSLCSFPHCCLRCSFPTSLLPSHTAINQEGRPGHESSRETRRPQQVLWEPRDGGRPRGSPLGPHTPGGPSAGTCCARESGWNAARRAWQQFRARGLPPAPARCSHKPRDAGVCTADSCPLPSRLEPTPHT